MTLKKDLGHLAGVFTERSKAKKLKLSGPCKLFRSSFGTAKIRGVVVFVVSY